jgi:hypothetical protein
MPSWAIYGNERARGPGPTGAAAATTTWNPSDKTTNCDLTNGDLTATSNSTAKFGARSIASAATGKKYWEITITVRAGVFTMTVGVANASYSLSAAGYTGETANSLGWYDDNEVFFNGTGTPLWVSWAQGDVLCLALDLDNGKIWGRKNGGNWNNDVIGNQDPANNIGGRTIPSGALYALVGSNTSSSIGDSVTANFGGSAYAQAVPSGFGNW